MTTDNTVAAPGVKLVTAWAAVGITSWSDLAAALAALYTLLLIGEWFYHKFFKSRFERRTGDGDC